MSIKIYRRQIDGGKWMTFSWLGIGYDISSAFITRYFLITCLLYVVLGTRTIATIFMSATSTDFIFIHLEKLSHTKNSSRSFIYNMFAYLLLISVVLLILQIIQQYEYSFIFIMNVYTVIYCVVLFGWSVNQHRLNKHNEMMLPNFNFWFILALLYQVDSLYFLLPPLEMTVHVDILRKQAISNTQIHLTGGCVPSPPKNGQTN